GARGMPTALSGSRKGFQNLQRTARSKVPHKRESGPSAPAARLLLRTPPAPAERATGARESRQQRTRRCVRARREGALKSTHVSHEYLDSIEAGPSLRHGEGGPSPRGSSKIRILFLAKIAIGVTLCAVIVARIDWRDASSSFAETGAGVVAVMFGILVALVFLSAYKWRLLLSIHGVEYSTLQLSRYYFVAIFFNNFLPTSIGGEDRKST